MAYVLSNEEEPDGSESNYAELKLKYNLKKALVLRNHSLSLLYFKIADKVKYVLSVCA